MKNNVILTGSSGYIGKKLTRWLNGKGFHVIALKREYLYGNSEDLAIQLKNSRAIIHLAGAVILRRWTLKNRQLIYSSRVDTTRNLVKAINLLPEDEQPECFISASAIGIYKSWQVHSESSNRFDNGFLGSVVIDWEKASDSLPANIRRVVFRTSLVLGLEAVIIKKMRLPFHFGLGGRIGNGRQPFPFIHIDDLLAAYGEAVSNKNFTGIYNLVAPEQITNAEFTRKFASSLNRSAFLSIPALLLKIIFGEASSVILESPWVKPERLTESGFRFRYPDISSALKEITGESGDKKSRSVS
jgi:uncharacterized protein